jgi:hypothetical protein
MPFMTLQVRIAAAAVVVDGDRDVPATVRRNPVAERHRRVAAAVAVAARRVSERRGHQGNARTRREGAHHEYEVALSRREPHVPSSSPECDYILVSSSELALSMRVPEHRDERCQTSAHKVTSPRPARHIDVLTLQVQPGRRGENVWNSSGR